METLHELEKGLTVDKATRQLARQLLDRLEGVSIFEDAISNTQGDFARAAAVLKDIGSSEQSFGIWLASMVTHHDLVDKLAENPILSVPLQHPPLLFKQNAIVVSHDEFVAFLRALIGVSCVLAIYAWADSLPEPLCRERTLGILRLWQDVDGYREVNFRTHLFHPFKIDHITSDPQSSPSASADDIPPRVHARFRRAQ